MNRSIQYSIIEHLRNRLNVPVEWERDGLDISEMPKPFVTVYNLLDNAEPIAAGREDFEENYHYQVTIRANSTDDAELLRTDLRRVLRERIALYDLSVQPFEVVRFFVVDVAGFTPILADSSSRETDHHRIHADVIVQTFYDTGNEQNTFTQ